MRWLNTVQNGPESDRDSGSWYSETARYRADSGQPGLMRSGVAVRAGLLRAGLQISMSPGRKNCLSLKNGLGDRRYGNISVICRSEHQQQPGRRCCTHGQERPEVSGVVESPEKENIQSSEKELRTSLHLTGRVTKTGGVIFTRQDYFFRK
jgi:hypothetical protein